MKLLTHNMLMSPGTKNGYPLAIEVEKMETVEAEFNGEFTARMVEKLDYAALLSTLRSVSDAGFSAREHVAGTAVCSCLCPNGSNLASTALCRDWVACCCASRVCWGRGVFESATSRAHGD